MNIDHQPAPQQPEAIHPALLLLMLYNGAIEYVQEAAHSASLQKAPLLMEAGLDRASAILSELSAALDHSADGQLTAGLYGLYTYMIRQLGRAKLSADAAAMEAVRDLLVGLRTTWEEAIEKSIEEHSLFMPEQILPVSGAVSGK